MASRLGSISCTPGTDVTAYFNGTDEAYIVTVNVCNIGNQACGFRMALTESATSSADAWIEYDTEIMGKGVLEREGIVVSPGQRLIVWSNTDLCSVNVYGIQIGPVQGAVPIVTNGDFTNGLDNWNTDSVTWNSQGFALMDNRIDGASQLDQDVALGTQINYVCTFDCVSYSGASNLFQATFVSGANNTSINITGVGSYQMNTITATTSLGALTFIGIDPGANSFCAIDNVRIQAV